MLWSSKQAWLLNQYEMVKLKCYNSYSNKIQRSVSSEQHLTKLHVRLLQCCWVCVFITTDHWSWVTTPFHLSQKECNWFFRPKYATMISLFVPNIDSYTERYIIQWPHLLSQKVCNWFFRPKYATSHTHTLSLFVPNIDSYTQKRFNELFLKMFNPTDTALFQWQTGHGKCTAMTTEQPFELSQ